MRACTITARNYWAQARVLSASIREHHPDATLSVLVVDADEHTKALGSRESFDVLVPADVGIDRREFHRMATCYDLLELATAMKPWLLLHLLGDNAGPVIYLDPDIELFSPITDAAMLADEHGIALTPHTVAPLPQDAFGPDELAILQSGVYNLGFIAVGEPGRPFLEWWRERLRRDCLISKEEGMFVDQRWVDFAPSYFNPAVLRSGGWNLAYWNMPARQLTRSATGYEVDTDPLRFFHYSGFDADRPDRLSYYQGDPPRIRLEEHPILAEFCASYAERLLRSGYRAYSRIPYGYEGTPTGLPLDQRIRRLYRRELVWAERSGGTEPPNPFESGESEAFEDWLRLPVGPYGLTRYLKTLYDERTDLHSTFTEVEGPKGSMFVDWVRAERRFECDVPPQLVPGAGAEQIGANVAGYFKASNGVGEAARALSDALDAGGVPHVVVPYENTASRQDVEALDARFSEPVYATNIVCVNADQTREFLDHAGPAFTEDRYTIGMWAWEVERMPEWMTRSVDLVDEIWVASEHAARAVRPWTTKPVLVAPYPVRVDAPRTATRAELGLPDGFLFLFSFDFDSVFERKNPLAVIDAFSRAFAVGEGRKLVIKSVRGDAHPNDLARLRAAASNHPDVLVEDGYLSRADYLALVHSCDAYVSLHRAEGFGLTIAEAMALAKPVIATAYSGNLEFMDETNSWLVPYEIVPVGKGSDPYPEDARWAQPNVDVAAALMREVVDDQPRARERGLRAATDIRRLHAPEARSGFLIARLRAAMETLRYRALQDQDEPEAAWTPADAAASLVSSGPVFDSPTRYGGMSKSFRRLLNRLLRHFGEHQSKIHSSLIESVRELEEQLRTQDATTRALEWHVHELARQLALAQQGDTPPVPPRVNGELEELLAVPVLDRRAAYMDLLAGHSPVLYVSCGDDEMHDLLAQRGVETVDIDLDPKDVDRVDYLEEIGDRSLGGILSARVVERMSPGDLWRFLELSRRKLTSDGLLVAETVNPPVVQAPKRTTVDGIHAISPETLVALCRLTGFESAYALFGGTADRTGRLDRTRRAQMEYAVVAQSSS